MRLSWEPFLLAGECVFAVAIVSSLIWKVCRKWSPVFWKRTDYAYFVLTVFGGATAAADFVPSLRQEARHARARVDESGVAPMRFAD
jgi:hypothetical protein